MRGHLVPFLSMLFWVAGSTAPLAAAEPLTLPQAKRPEWLAREGIVMAGSREPLLFRVRRDGASGYEPTPEQLAAYEREHSPEMIAALKAMGVNFVMMHGYKGAGLGAEARSMQEAVRFARLCREAGLRVGVYNFSGAFLWELFFREVPQARDWVVLDARGNPVTYGGAAYRYYWNRNHPEAQAFYRQLVRFAVEEMRADLIHFDNYVVGPGADDHSVRRFREYLARRFTPEQRRRLGLSDIESARPPLTGPPDSPLRRAWLDFACQSLADSYADMCRYARTLRGDILVECNPGGVPGRVEPPVDHARLLENGEAFWDEGRPPGLRNGTLHSRIRTYKVARKMGNMAFAYVTTPLEAAESMAFNRDCLGCICWFEYARIVSMPGSKDPVSLELPAYVRFFRTRRDLLRGGSVVADVAVLRSFASQAFGSGAQTLLANRVEQALIEQRIPFQIVYDRHLADLWDYRVLVLAGCPALSDAEVSSIRRFVEAGGRLCLIGSAATHDEWFVPRDQPALDALPDSRVVRLGMDDDAVAGIRRALGGSCSLSADAPQGLCAELVEQPGRRLVHLVNYRPDGPVRGLAVAVRLPPSVRARRVVIAAPEQDDDRPVAFRENNGVVEFEVPAVKVYAIAVVEYERGTASSHGREAERSTGPQGASPGSGSISSPPTVEPPSGTRAR